MPDKNDLKRSLPGDEDLLNPDDKHQSDEEEDQKRPEIDGKDCHSVSGGENFKIRKLSSDSDMPPHDITDRVNFDPLTILKNLLTNQSSLTPTTGTSNSEDNQIVEGGIPLDLMKRCLTMIHNKQLIASSTASQEINQSFNSEGNNSCSFSKDDQNVDENDGEQFQDQYLKMRQKLMENEFRRNFYNYEKPTMFQKMLYSSELSPNQKLLEKHEDMLRRFTSFDECSAKQCSKNLTREHYHCTQCERVIIRREEMVRHVKWHKKREESLQYGFMRFSPNDDCKNFNCVHNGKQTHYHCLQINCPKIYVSTSDVQMHANYHRKDAIIMQDGFQRYRATEDCGLSTCPYNAERTTHFHCRRPECFFTFKNKADIEKHKGHHQKNDNYAKDGFRKFIKYESCDFAGCKYSKIMNHIHCIRRDCDYVVHSSSQILSHKRKHDRRQLSSSPINFSSDSSCRDDEEFFFPIQSGASYEDVLNDFRKKISSVVINSMTLLRLNETDRDIVYIEITDPIGRELFAELHGSITISDEVTCPKFSDCNPNHGHYHCSWQGCTEKTGPLFKYRSHWLSHAWTGAALRCGFMKCRSHFGCSITSLHHHCFFWPQCSHIIHGNVSKNYCADLCEHLSINEFGSPESSSSSTANMILAKEKSKSNQFSPKSLFQSFNYTSATPRRRGRPPKHKRDVTVPHVNPDGKILCNYSLEQNLTREMFIKQKNIISKDSPNYGIVFGIRMYEEGEQCIDDKCHFQQGLQEHYHCAKPRCFLVSQSLVYINMHRKEFHGHLTIDEGFEHFDRTVDCRRRTCHNNRLSRHYHCVRSDCDYSFVRYSTMRQHGKKHEKEESLCDEDRTSTNLSPSNTSNISLPDQSISCVNDSYKRLREEFQYKILNILPNSQIVPSQTNNSNVIYPDKSSGQESSNTNQESFGQKDDNPFMSMLGLQPFDKRDIVLENIVQNFPNHLRPGSQEDVNLFPEILKSCLSKLFKSNNNNDLNLSIPDSVDYLPEEVSLFGDK